MPTPAQVTRTMENVRGQRYGELLLLSQDESGLSAEVYTTFTRNDCPEALWTALDLTDIPRSEGALAAVANGPRYWLVDTIEKIGPETPQVKWFGGLEMARAAKLELGATFDPSPYRERRVDRNSVFSFDEGQPVYELTGADGAVYVMQSWCTSVEPELVETDLAILGDRLDLPEGWTYSGRRLGGPLRVVTTTEEAVVLQDHLRNSYSRLN